MATDPNNPFELPQQPQPQQQWGGMPQITPQEGQNPYAGGSHFELSPEAMQMMWAPQPPQPQVQLPPLPPPQPPV